MPLNWLRKPDLAAALAAERPLLDRIFGSESYELISLDEDAVLARSSRFSLQIAYDSGRDRSVTSELSTDAWEEEVAGTHEWLRFLEERMPVAPRDRSGRVRLSLDDQVREELTWVLRVAEAIFSDPQKTRDAVQFIRGHRVAYNDWASERGMRPD